MKSILSIEQKKFGMGLKKIVFFGLFSNMHQISFFSAYILCEVKKMKLNELLVDTDVSKIVGYIEDIEILDITLSSRHSKQGSLFVAQKGENFDGHFFVEEAIINGAVAIVVEKYLPAYNIPQIVVKSTRRAIASLAATFYGEPHKKLKFIGVTGTNGKTSCALFIAEILNSSNLPCAFIGTTGAFFQGKEFSSHLTTPDPLVLHKLLKAFLDLGAKYVCMEVSAHAIKLEKVFNITFEVGILTNITQDHLDYFKTMNAYSKTKLSWLQSEKVKTIIVNADDKYGQKLLGKKLETLSFGLENPADVFAVNIENNPLGFSFTLNLLDNVFCCHTKLVGTFNLYNILAVASGCFCLGLPIKTLQKSISLLSPPKGRFNTLHLKDNKTIIVDFAHTPDGLENALKSARKLCTDGKLYALFGCGGDRDKLKRPIMGRIAEQNADFVILTSDNPRFEKPENILSDIEKGFLGHNYLKIADRKLAIFKLIECLAPNDIAVVCGKGGENYQDINGIKLPYDDFDEIKKSAKTILDEEPTKIKESLC